MGRVQTGAFDNLIRRLYSIKGGGSELSDTLGDLFPVLDLENLPSELLILRGWRIFAGFATSVGVAAQTTGLQLVVPAGRDSIAVVTKITILSQLTQTITLGVNLAPFSLVTSTFNQDTRAPETNNANAQIFGSQNVGAIANAASILVTANVIKEFEIPGSLAVVSPGQAFSVISSVADSDLTCSFFGRERIAEPSELSF